MSLQYLEHEGFEDGLNPYEVYWRDRFDWLYQCGYELRPRYHPDWVPSWVEDPTLAAKKYLCEDAVQIKRVHIIDATRIRDGNRVILKRVDGSRHPYETDIHLKLSQEDWLNDPHNHAVPLLDLLEPPFVGEENVFFLVMPLLSLYDDPEFQTFGEVIGLLGQMFEGVQSLHHNLIAHRQVTKLFIHCALLTLFSDIHALNIMVDARPLCSQETHPVDQYLDRSYRKLVEKSTRTEHPVRYYLIDFGISRMYAPEDFPPLEYPILGIDKTVPEFAQDPHVPQNPFPTDIYYLGSFIKEQFILGRPGTISIPGYHGFEFLLPLVTDMAQDNPHMRPAIDEVIERFTIIVNRLSWWKLRSRLIPRLETFRNRSPFFKHWFRNIRYIFRGLDAIPPTPRL
ncbi:hypothetical protein D9613_000140 [Agrocybe pediades]|uniref:Protein kinase domain-containing protein n=1 Tax=Agrocybe pediades TaxID=84607 RepID=A0A8H4VT23_9AGAR|nr:hypothetical protein D9613_000140 [Agrocybe pediades]